MTPLPEMRNPAHHSILRRMTILGRFFGVSGLWSVSPRHCHGIATGLLRYCSHVHRYPPYGPPRHEADNILYHNTLQMTAILGRFLGVFGVQACCSSAAPVLIRCWSLVHRYPLRRGLVPSFRPGPHTLLRSKNEPPFSRPRKRSGHSASARQFPRPALDVHYRWSVWSP